MFPHFNRASDKTNTSIYYSADTYKGSSSAPAYIQFDNDPIPIILGVRTRADTETTPSESNQARRVDNIA